MTCARCLGLGRAVLRDGAREGSWVLRALDFTLRIHSFFSQISSSLCVDTRQSLLCNPESCFFFFFSLMVFCSSIDLPQRLLAFLAALQVSSLSKIYCKMYCKVLCDLTIMFACYQYCISGFSIPVFMVNTVLGKCVGPRAEWRNLLTHLIPISL